MKIIQCLPCLTYGDAVGNDTLSLDSVIRERKNQTHIYAEYISPQISDELCSHFSKILQLKNEDIIISHVAVASELNNWIQNQKCRKVMIYHNITPPEFFLDYHSVAYLACKNGYDEVKKLPGHPHQLQSAFDADALGERQTLCGRELPVECDNGEIAQAD